ncbi:MAG: CvpA family protein [Muribaculaceae bacterium]|nr:CvpA family protein [Muribaculaceae bacterium]
MTTIDVVIIGLFIATAVAGYRRGILRQLGVVAGVVAGIAACRCLSGDFAYWLGNREFFHSMTDNAPAAVVSHAAGVVASTLLFVGAYIAVQILAGMVRGVVHGSALGFVDSCMGMVTSVFVGFLVLSIILNVCQAFKQGGSVIDKSTLAGGSVARTVLDLAPRTFGVATAVFDKYVHTPSEP